MSNALDSAYSEAQELLKKTNKQIEENEKHIETILVKTDFWLFDKELLKEIHEKAWLEFDNKQ